MPSLPNLLILVRHGESTCNVVGAELNLPTHRYPLTDVGRSQVLATAEFLKIKYPISFDACYCSYYQRARETLELLAPGQRIIEDPRLAEAQRGVYHYYPRNELSRLLPLERERLNFEGKYHYRPFGGENWLDVELRILSFLNYLRLCHSGGQVLVVVHSHWLLLFNRLLRGFSIDEAVRRYENGELQNFAGVTIYRGLMDGGRESLELDNYVAYKQ